MAIILKNNQSIYKQWLLALEEAKKRGKLPKNDNRTKIPLGK